MRHGRRVGPRGHEAGDMGHVHHKARAHAVGDGDHALKVDDARVRRGACDD